MAWRLGRRPAALAAALLFLGSVAGPWGTPAAVAAPQPIHSTAVLDRLWREAMARVGAREAEVNTQAELRTRTSMRPGVVGALQAYWLNGRLTRVRGLSNVGSWTLLADAQGRLLAVEDVHEQAEGSQWQVLFMRGQGGWLCNTERREVGLRAGYHELRWAKPSEVAEQERRWTSLKHELSAAQAT